MNSFRVRLLGFLQRFADSIIDAVNERYTGANTMAYMAITRGAEARANNARERRMNRRLLDYRRASAAGGLARRATRVDQWRR